MYLLYADETNVHESNEFFVYGGIAIPQEAIVPLSEGIEELRNKYGYGSDDILKFNVRDTPKHIARSDARKLKDEIVQLAVKHKVTLFASLVLHDIAKRFPRLYEFQVGRMCHFFNRFLQDKDDFGFAHFDPFEGITQALSRYFRNGVKFTQYYHQIKRIKGLHISPMGTSHFCSLVDIILGYLRYAINSRNDAHRNEIIKTMLAKISPLFYRNNRGRLNDIALYMGPQEIVDAGYLKKYDELYDFFKRNELEPALRPQLKRIR